jgi:hypothetical protein
VSAPTDVVFSRSFSPPFLRRLSTSFYEQALRSGSLGRRSSLPRQRRRRYRPGVNVIKLFSFITDDEAQ